jgi:hypothetical protein
MLKSNLYLIRASLVALSHLTLSPLLIPSGDAHAYFPPDEATQEALQKLPLLDSPERGRDYLQSFLSEAEVSRPIIQENHTYQGAPVFTRLIEKPSFDHGLPARTTAGLTPDGYLEIRVEITPEGLRSPVVLMEERSRLEQIFAPVHPSHNPVFPEEFAEISWNSEAGSTKATVALRKLDMGNAMAVQGSLDVGTLTTLTGELKEQELAAYRAYAQARRVHAEKRFREATQTASKDQAQRKKAWELRKKKFDDFEKLPEKLNHLVAQNDRKGTAALLREYLPWELMEPMETRYWRGSIEAIENPDPQKTVLLFRGLDEYDKSVFDNNQKSLFSTLLSRNQGNYTRRLRSFSTKIEGFQFPVLTDLQDLKPKLSTWTAGPYRHSFAPEGSPYLSFTKSAMTANSFASHGIVAVNVDSRKVVPSWLSPFQAEAEHLVPLLVFPDEIISGGTFDPTNLLPEDKMEKTTAFYDDVAQKTGFDPRLIQDPAGFTAAELRKPYELLGAQGPDYSEGHVQIRDCLIRAFRQPK